MFNVKYEDVKDTSASMSHLISTIPISDLLSYVKEYNLCPMSLRSLILYKFNPVELLGWLNNDTLYMNMKSRLGDESIFLVREVPTTRSNCRQQTGNSILN